MKTYHIEFENDAEARKALALLALGQSGMVSLGFGTAKAILVVDVADDSAFDGVDGHPAKLVAQTEPQPQPAPEPAPTTTPLPQTEEGEGAL